MKLTRENIYVNLQGKSKEELTELYNFLESVGEKQFNTLKSFLNTDTEGWRFYLFGRLNQWTHSGSSYGKQEVTIQELKEILQPMENKEKQLIKEAKERGFLTEGNEFYSCFDDKNELRIIKPYNSNSKKNLYLDSNGYLRHHDGLNNEYDESLCSNPAIYKDGVWAEIKNNNLTLTEQLEKAEAEVKRLKEAIEEERKPKVGDWLISNDNITICKVTQKGLDYINDWKTDFYKCEDQELINKLNELIK